jgi:kumamolisin
MALRRDTDKVLPSDHPLAGGERPPHQETKRLEAASADETVTVTFIVRRRPDGPPLKTHEDFQKAPFGTLRHLSSQEFEEAYGAIQADLDQVGSFCRSHGLTVSQSNRSRRSVIASGTVAQMNSAFAVTLYHYQSPLGRYHGYEGQVRLPANLDGIVEAVLGLDNRPVPSRPLSADPPSTNPLTPLQVGKLYNFPAGTGAGQTIGIYEGPGAGYTMSDLQLTMNAFGGGLTVPTPTDFPAGSNLGASATGDPRTETILDITVSSAVAQGANIVVYFNTGSAATDIISTLGSMIHPSGSDPVPTILSISYVWSADDDDTSFLTPSDYTQIDNLFSDAAQKGITVCVASGDTGAMCESPIQAQVWFPGSDPWVLSCGGTTIGDISGSSFDEYVWYDTFGGGSGATGGGVSARFPVPVWQNNVTVPKRNGTGTVGRGTPDVAGNASPNSGYPIFIGGTSVGPVGGTSAVAPLYAGLVALLNQNLGQSIGFLNPIIYARGPSVCRDVTGAAGPANNSFDSVTGYPAGVGWDACTGWGSISGAALLGAVASTASPCPLLEQLFMWAAKTQNASVYVKVTLTTIVTGNGLAAAVSAGNKIVVTNETGSGTLNYVSPPAFSGSVEMAGGPTQVTISSLIQSPGPRQIFAYSVYIAYVGTLIPSNCKVQGQNPISGTLGSPIGSAGGYFMTMSISAVR